MEANKVALGQYCTVPFPTKKIYCYEDQAEEDVLKKTEELKTTTLKLPRCQIKNHHR